MKAPVYETLRPSSFEEVVGQKHLVGQGGLLHALIAKKRPLSLLLWGPPGCGKTTIARLYGKAFSCPFFTISGSDGQIAEAKRLIKEIESQPLIYSHAVLFVDEIHRLNKSSQDLFLPYIEKGLLTLIAATTENPSFSINNALLSRMQVFECTPLSSDDLGKVIDRFLSKNSDIELTADAKSCLLSYADGDARFLLSALESLSLYMTGLVDSEEVSKALSKKRPAYDKAGDGHYNLISALHKAVRASDADAALYWFARMIDAGEDLKFLARRLVRMASEDIGLADPNALSITNAAAAAYERLGLPEGALSLAQAVVYLSLAPKSNALYTAYGKALSYAKSYSAASPPKHALNAPTKLMKKAGYGDGYIYDHDTQYGCSGLSYFPEELTERPRFYKPVSRGEEREFQKKLDFYDKLREQAKIPQS